MLDGGTNELSNSAVFASCRSHFNHNLLVCAHATSVLVFCLCIRVPDVPLYDCMRTPWRHLLTPRNCRSTDMERLWSALWYIWLIIYASGVIRPLMKICFLKNIPKCDLFAFSGALFSTVLRWFSLRALSPSYDLDFGLFPICGIYAMRTFVKFLGTALLDNGN